jgi:hypothetical protein
MSVISDVLGALKTAIQLEERVKSMAGNVANLAQEVREIDKRLVRLETIIEFGTRNSSPPPPPPVIEDNR